MMSERQGTDLAKGATRVAICMIMTCIFFKCYFYLCFTIKTKMLTCFRFVIAFKCKL